MSFSPRTTLSAQGLRFEASPQFLGLLPVLEKDAALQLRAGDAKQPWQALPLSAPDLISEQPAALQRPLEFASKQAANLSVEFEGGKILGARFTQLQGVLSRVLALRTVLEKVLAGVQRRG